MSIIVARLSLLVPLGISNLCCRGPILSDNLLVKFDIYVCACVFVKTFASVFLPQTPQEQQRAPNIFFVPFSASQPSYKRVSFWLTSHPGQQAVFSSAAEFGRSFSSFARRIGRTFLGVFSSEVRTEIRFFSPSPSGNFREDVDFHCQTVVLARIAENGPDLA